MSVYESIEKYAEFTNMSLEQAKTRYNYFMDVRKQMYESKKCPKCQQYTLELEGGEWEAGIQDWIYCENDTIETIDDEGDVYFEECDFTDDVKEEYIFAVEVDFDVVIYFSCQIEDEGLESVERMIGCTWKEFVDEENKELLLSLNV